MSIAAEQLAVDRLREWFLLKLPGRVATVNATRAAVLSAPLPGPYTIPVGATLHYTGSNLESTTTDIPLTSGSRTAAEVAADIELVVPGLASVDGTDRLVLTSATAPSTGTDSLVRLGEDTTGANAALGFDAGGELAFRAALIAPSVKGVADGAPMIPDMGTGFWLIMGDSVSVPVVPDVRRDENLVSVAVTIAVPMPVMNPHRDREHLRAALRCVREVLFLEDFGRTLGNAPGIILVQEKQAQLRSRPIAYAELPNVLFCRAGIELLVRVFERQA